LFVVLVKSSQEEVHSSYSFACCFGCYHNSRRPGCQVQVRYVTVRS